MDDGGKPIFTNVPGGSSIELVEYYNEFVEYYPNCELQTKSWFVRFVQRDWHIFDCGANIGYYSILFSRLAPNGVIHAFEPTGTSAMLQANLEHHGVRNVHIVEEALTDKSGRYIDDVYQVWGQEPLRQQFTFTTIDDFIDLNGINRLDCIKIDVDSYDFAVLRGAKKTLLRFDPYVMVELNHALSLRNENAMQALQWMSALGYTWTEVYDCENFLFKRGLERAGSSQEFILRFPKM